MRISKVNHNTTSGKTTIAYETVENEGKDTLEHVLHTGDDPAPSFVAALEALRAEIETLAELPEGYLTAVRGITIHRDEEDPDGEWTVTYTATKTLGDSRSPLVLNTPAVLPPSPKGVRALLKEAEAFVRGTRAQQELPFKEERPAKAKPAEPLLPPPDEPPPAVEEPAMAEPEQPDAAGPFEKEPPPDGTWVCEASLPDGKTARIRSDDGKWTGRIDGIPFAIEQASAKACADLIAREYPDANLLWGWLDASAPEV